MKNILKRISLISALVIGFALPAIANDEPADDETLLCQLFPWTCSGSTSGAGGTGHGGSNIANFQEYKEN